MKKWSVAFTVMMTVMFTAAMPVHAKGDKIESGIYANDMDLSGMTVEEARQMIESYVESYGNTQITLHAVDEGTIATTAAECVPGQDGGRFSGYGRTAGDRDRYGGIHGRSL